MTAKIQLLPIFPYLGIEFTEEPNMAQVINTNIMSLNAQRQLNKSQATTNEAMERLSSGLRVNSAKDDAAGLAISTGMQSQIKGINQAVRNSNDGISMAQTAEGSMDEMTNILQRMRELSVQSSNDTNSASNREAIQQEVSQLHSELDRIAETTDFNGTKLLDGSSGDTTLQIGANSGQTLSFSIDSVTTNDLGLNGDLQKEELNGGRVTNGDIGKDTIELNGVKLPAFDNDTSVGNVAGGMADTINLKTSETGVTANAYNVVEGKSEDPEGLQLTGVTSGLEISVGSNETVTLGATSSMSNLAETINRDVDGVNAALSNEGALLLTNDTGEQITVSAGSGTGIDNSGLADIADAVQEGYLALDSADNSPISINDSGSGVSSVEASKMGFLASNGAGSVITETVAADGGFAGNIDAADALQINGVDLVVTGADATNGATTAETVDAINKLTDDTGVTAEVFTDAATSATSIMLSSKDGSAIEVTSGANGQTAQTTALAKVGMQSEMGGKVSDSLGTNVSTMEAAVNSIDKIDVALDKISDSRANLGAIQNRLSSTISNLENVSQNLSASNSRIVDADFAAETSKMSKSQILQQAGTSMLAQANASSEGVMSLLQ